MKPKENEFCEFYCLTENPREAAFKAGYRLLSLIHISKPFVKRCRRLRIIYTIINTLFKSVNHYFLPCGDAFFIDFGRALEYYNKYPVKGTCDREPVPIKNGAKSRSTEKTTKKR